MSIAITSEGHAPFELTMGDGMNINTNYTPFSRAEGIPMFTFNKYARIQKIQPTYPESTGKGTFWDRYFRQS